MTKMVIQPEVIWFESMVEPLGLLNRQPGCHALMYYAILVKQQIAQRDETIKYEEEVWTRVLQDARTLFKSVAQMYGVEPEVMVKFWPNVDAQLALVGSPRVPNEFRFDKIAEIGT